MSQQACHWEFKRVLNGSPKYVGDRQHRGIHFRILKSELQAMMHRGHKGDEDYAAQQQVLQEHMMQVSARLASRSTLFWQLLWEQSLVVVSHHRKHRIIEACPLLCVETRGN